MKSPLKWTGSKRRMLPLLREITQDWDASGDGIYHEPFMGGGSLFFDLSPTTAELSDSNPDLIAFYRWLRDDVQSLEECVSQLPIGYNAIKADFNACRQLADGEKHGGYPIQQSARFLALLHLGFNGLWRVNKAGDHNVPVGKQPDGSLKSVATIDWGCLTACSKALSSASLLVADFRSDLVDCLDAKPGDLVFFDPPYLKTFSGYAKEGFTRVDHEDLARLCEKLGESGVFTILAGSNSEDSMEVYGTPTHVIETKGCIAAKAKGRKMVSECVWVWK